MDKVGITEEIGFGGLITARACCWPRVWVSPRVRVDDGGAPGYIDLVKHFLLAEMHYGSKDKGIPLEQVEDLKES